VTLDVRPAAGDAEREAALALRRRVFCEEQGVPVEQELDGHDTRGLHLVAVQDGAVLGTCRLLMRGSSCTLSRMAVDAGFRRTGVGAALLRESEARARERGATRMALHAQLRAQRLYTAHGYRARGPRFLEAGIEHVSMEKAL
jgi:predicted GNAT family N-acyltransferase